nr:protein nap1 [Quercus suber]
MGLSSVAVMVLAAGEAGTDGGHRLGRCHWFFCRLGDEKLMWRCRIYADCRGWFGLVQDFMRQILERCVDELESQFSKHGSLKKLYFNHQHLTETQGMRQDVFPYKGMLSALTRIAHEEGIRELHSLVQWDLLLEEKHS